MKNNPNFDKEDYKLLKDIAKATGAGVAARKDTNGDWANIYNGVSVAFRPMSKTPDCRMLAVAVSYCATEDTFKKKIGKYQALYKLEKGEYIQLPLGEFYRECGEEETAEFLLRMFGSI